MKRQPELVQIHRLAVKTLDQVFVARAREGLGCSLFEAQALTELVKYFHSARCQRQLSQACPTNDDRQIHHGLRQVMSEKKVWVVLPNPTRFYPNCRRSSKRRWFGFKGRDSPAGGKVTRELGVRKVQSVSGLVH